MVRTLEGDAFYKIRELGFHHNGDLPDVILDKIKLLVSGDLSIEIPQSY